MLNEVFVVPKVGVEPTGVLPQWILNLLGRVMLVLVGVRLHLEITNSRLNVVRSTPRLYTRVAVRVTVKNSPRLDRSGGTSA